MSDQRAKWYDRLRDLACVGGEPPEQGVRDAREFIAGFSDEMGHRREVDAYLLAGVLRRRGHDVPVPVVKGGAQELHALWRAALSRAHEPRLEDAELRALGLAGAPPMLALAAFRTIEVWSESLLCALHAMSWLEIPGVRSAGGELLGRSERMRDRLDSEARWIVERIEPDNATRHPWGVHVFIDLFLREGDHGAVMYAEDLLHVCRVSTGRADRLSVWILLDAADALVAMGER